MSTLQVGQLIADTIQEGGLGMGATFYVGREIRDREKLGHWDWPVLIAPVATCLLLWGIFVVWL